MSDIQEKKKILEPLQVEKPCNDAPAQPRDEKIAAKRIVSAANWIGVNTLMNSSLSLWITFKALPTHTAQSAMRSMGKWVFKPMVIATDKIKGLFGKSVLNGLSEEKANFKINENARSTAEVVCMVIAGSLLLPVIKYVENHKNQWVDKIDGWLHPSHKHQEKSTDHHEESITWGKLLKARAIGLAGVFSVNHAMQEFNNAHPESFFNSDVGFTKIGNKLFDKLPEKVRHRVVWVFSGFSNSKISVGSIQKDMRERAFRDAPKELKDMVHETAILHNKIYTDPELYKVGGQTRKEMLKAGKILIENNELEIAAKINERPHLKPIVEKAIFGEQTRLFGKELSLTLLITGIMYAIAKKQGSLVGGVLEKCGLKNKAEKQPAPAAMKHEAQTDNESTDKNWAERPEIKDREQKKTIQKIASFKDAITQKSSESVAFIA